MKNALLVYPQFSPYGFWNYLDVCKLTGAKYPAAPLGIITMAALLPNDWNLKLINENTRKLKDADIEWADMVFISGMLPQQGNFLKLIDRIHAKGKKVVAGGPDPTSQPEIYKSADFIVMGEAETNITQFLDDIEKGKSYGRYPLQSEKPSMEISPVPRFDLLNFKEYLMVGIQVSRGCPFNCDFCDIIELYGRVPRLKQPKQIINELNTLYELGYRGHIDFVDDNFIGNKVVTKAILREIKTWSQQHNHPFFFSTEASINLADDDELLELMRDVDFRYVFIGIESSDNTVLKNSQKSQNLNRDIAACLHKIYSYGIIVNGGFIIGFDSETSISARSVVDTINNGNLPMSMIGLLYALPNTQLTKRLQKENRFFEGSNKDNAIETNGKSFIDQTTNGLNFITKRPVKEIISDYLYVIRNVFSRKNYFNRCLNICKVLKGKKQHRPPFLKTMRNLIAFGKLIVHLGIKPMTFYYFWRNIILISFTRPSNIEDLVNLMAMYIHFQKQSKYIVKSLSI